MKRLFELSSGTCIVIDSIDVIEYYEEEAGIDESWNIIFRGGYEVRVKSWDDMRAIFKNFYLKQSSEYK